MRSFFYGSTLRLRFSCEFSFTLSSFSGDRILLSPLLLVLWEVQGLSFSNFWGFLCSFGPLFLCAYDLSLRDSLGGRSLGLSLAGPLVILVIGCAVCYFPCSLPCSFTCPLGTIISRGASRIFF